jgi:MipA family protein
MKSYIRLGALLAALIAPAFAHAQDMAPGWEATAGAGVMVAPAYTGADEYQLSAVPDISVKYEDKFFASVHDGVGYNVVNTTGGLRAGPIARYDWGRDEDGERFLRLSGDKSDDLRGLGDVDGAPELGGFVAYDITPSLTAEGEIRQAIGGHEGLVSDMGVNYHTQLGGFPMPVYFSAGPRMKLASADYNEAYFGIDAGQSTASGMPAYTPDGGVVSYGFGSSVTVPVSKRIRTTAFAGYDRLGDEPGDSPLVEDRGSRNQGMVGLSVGYAFQ